MTIYYDFVITIFVVSITIIYLIRRSKIINLEKNIKKYNEFITNCEFVTNCEYHEFIEYIEHILNKYEQIQEQQYEQIQLQLQEVQQVQQVQQVQIQEQVQQIQEQEQVQQIQEQEQVQQVQQIQEQVQQEEDIQKKQRIFNINKDEFTIIKLNETLNIGLSIIIEDKEINYNNIKKLLNSRLEQHRDTNYTYRLTRDELKKLVIGSCL